MLIKYYPFECTSIWTVIIKRLWKVKKMVMVTLKLQRYFVIYKRSPLKMQKIIKPRCPSRQLLETVNFAFMKIFDFLVKIAVFRASLLFLGRFPSCMSPQFYDFLHLKGWPFINHKISQQIFGKFRFLNLRSLKYIIIVQKINISTIGNFFIFSLVFQTLWELNISLLPSFKTVKFQ